MVFQKINRFRNLPYFDVIFDKKQGAWRQAGEIVKYVNNLAEDVYKRQHQYMTNVTAALTEGQSVAKGYSDKNQAFTFRIPVYDLSLIHI